MDKHDPTLPKRKQPRVRQMIGRELRKSVGDLVSKFRRIDREANTYDETVHDAEGNVIHEDHGKLSDHKGHGSDKKNQPPG